MTDPWTIHDGELAWQICDADGDVLDCLPRSWPLDLVRVVACRLYGNDNAADMESLWRCLVQLGWLGAWSVVAFGLGLLAGRL